MKTLLVLAMCVVLLGCQSPTPTDQSSESRTGVGEDEGRNRNSQSQAECLRNQIFIGVVENGTLRIVLPQSVSSGYRFTSIAMQEARPPETGELDLSQYEGRAIAIQGHDGGGWIYSARVVDTGSPIVTALVRQVGDQ